MSSIMDLIRTIFGAPQQNQLRLEDQQQQWEIITSSPYDEYTAQSITIIEKQTSGLLTQEDIAHMEFLSSHMSGFMHDTVDVFNAGTDVLNAGANVINSGQVIFVAACEIYRISKELDLLISQSEQNHQVRLEKIRSLETFKPIIDSWIAHIDKHMDQIDKIDPNTCSRQQLEYRTTLLQRMSDLNEKLFQVMMKFMSI